MRNTYFILIFLFCHVVPGFGQSKDNLYPEQNVSTILYHSRIEKSGSAIHKIQQGKARFNLMKQTNRKKRPKAGLQNQIEINPYFRWDWYPQFTSYDDPSNPSYLTIHGQSWGLGITYKKAISKSAYLKTGIGYFRYSFNHIKQYNRRYGKGDTRVLNIVWPEYVILTTKNYWYNTINAVIGVEKIFIENRSYQLTAGLDVRNYFTFSERYKNPLMKDGKYKLTKTRYFGASAIIHAAFTKRIGKLGIGPSIGLPFFSFWGKDRTFPNEKNHEYRKKWLGAIEIGIVFDLSISSKK